MATSSIILTLLKFCASKQRTPIINYSDFVDYLVRYSQHHLNESPELVPFANGAMETLQSELEVLAAKKQIGLVVQGQDRSIAVLSYFIELYTETYTELEKSFTKPFPTINGIPKGVPGSLFVTGSASEILSGLLKKNAVDDKSLYSIQFAKGVPSLLFPSTISVRVLIFIALKKLQDLLRKEESHDYFLKKLTISNPGKEIAIKNFFNQFVAKPEEAWESLRTTGDTFYYWSQLCYFLKQDYTKLKDFTTEDVNILQSIMIIEVAASYYKTQTAERISKETAFKELDEKLLLPPYYFSMDDISRMQDKHGTILLEKYSEKELQDHLTALTAEAPGNQLPKMLTFRVEDTGRFFIFKEKIMPLIVKLSNDARDTIKESLNKVWYEYLQNFETLPEMKEQPAFEKCLEREVKACSPILYALLTASFLPVVALDDQTPGKVLLFKDGHLIPYSEILLLSRQEIYSNAKIKLPFWYSIPIISWIMNAVMQKSKTKKKRDSAQAATTKTLEEEKRKAEQKESALDAKDSGDPQKNRKRELRKAASAVESHLVPQTSTIDRELQSYLQEWNDRINKEAHDNLETDVNTLVRDYVRKTLRSLRTENLTSERISHLADSLVNTPSLMKIKNHAALKRYVELYMVKLIKNLP